MSVEVVTNLKLACPACGAVLPEALHCPGCGREFQLVSGIPDLRLEYPDAYLSWEEDVTQARKLADAEADADFADLLRLHWRMSGRPERLTERFVTSDLGAVPRSAAYLDAIEEERGVPLGSGDTLLEVGCGSGSLAVAAAGRGCRVAATDISMRWVALARKRLAEEGLEGVTLVCSSAEQPPFAPESFDVVVASDVIEHVASQRDFAAASARVLKPGGLLFLATPNRFTLGLEPHVRLWGVGFLPRRLADRYVRRRRKSTHYESVRVRSALGLRKLLRGAGLEPRIVPPAIPAATQELYGGLELQLVRTYNRLRRYAPVRVGLLAVGPFFHVFARKP